VLIKYVIQTVLYVSLILSEDADQDVELIWNVFELSTSSDALGPGHVIIDPDKDRDYEQVLALAGLGMLINVRVFTVDSWLTIVANSIALVLPHLPETGKSYFHFEAFC
jgi:hypothetical protein